MSDIINYSAVSKLLTGHPGNLRKGSVPRKYKPDVQALEHLVGGWLDKIIADGSFDSLNHGDPVEVGRDRGFITCTYEGRDKCVAVKYLTPVMRDGSYISEEILSGVQLLSLKKLSNG